MKIMALKQLQAASPALYDPIAIDMAALKAIGWSNPEQFMAPPQAQANPPPELLVKQAELQIKGRLADATMAESQAKVAKTQSDIQNDKARVAGELMDAQSNAQKTNAEEHYAEKDLDSKSEERLSRERIQLIDLAQNLAVHPNSAALVQPLVVPAMQNIIRQQGAEAVNLQQKRRGLVPPNRG
jgi:hypothetical protein